VVRSIGLRSDAGVALSEARKGLNRGGIPIGAAIFDASGNLIGRATTVACRTVTPPDSTECATMLATCIAAHPEVWNEDIGEE
jgi:tRNA(Arg) A34 adenosine deaminase TadA